jgi:hypothetical protein
MCLLLIFVVSGLAGCVSRQEPEPPPAFIPEGAWDAYDAVISGDFITKANQEVELPYAPRAVMFFEDGVMGEYSDAGFLNCYNYTFDESAQRLSFYHVGGSEADSLVINFFTEGGLKDVFFYEYSQNGSVMTGCFARNLTNDDRFRSDFDTSGIWAMMGSDSSTGEDALIFDYAPDHIVMDSESYVLYRAARAVLEHENSAEILAAQEPESADDIRATADKGVESFPYDYFEKVLTVFRDDGEKAYYIDKLDGEYRIYFTELYWGGIDAGYKEWGVFTPGGMLFDAADYKVLEPVNDGLEEALEQLMQDLTAAN